MENKLYTLILLLFFSAVLPAKAQTQDSTTCNPRFSTYLSRNQAFFQAIDSQGVVVHSWNFGDSTTTGFRHSYSTISHTYSHPGTYKVTHIIKDSAGGGCYDSSSQTISVTLPPACSIYFDANRDTINHHIYNFFAHPYPDAGVQDTVRWYVNDTLIGTGRNLLHQYFPSGTFNLCVRLSAGGGCRSTQCGQIIVAGDSCGRPVSFTHQADSSHPLLIRFYPSPDDINVQYRWNFGDSTPLSTDRRPTHLYASAGAYLVSLTEIYHAGADSCRSSAAQTVDVNFTPPPPCQVRFTYTANPQKRNELTFILQDTVQYDSVVWWVNKIPDSLYRQRFYGRQFTHLFSDTGCYAIFVTTFGSTCPGSAYQQVCIDSISSGPGSFIASYPNPATSQVKLDLKLTKDNTIYIYIFNSMGNEIQTSQAPGYIGINHVTIPTGNLPTGIYYVQIQYGNEIRRSKIQKL